MIVSVRHDFYRFGETLNDFQRRQLPFAAALALTATARSAQRVVTGEIPQIFNHKGPPTPFTRRAVGITPARKSNLRAEVFVKRAQAKYLGIEETGGAVHPAPGAPILTPVNAPLNAYANIPRGTVRKLAGRDRYFLGTVHGVYGLWERLRPTPGAGGAQHHLRLVAAMRQHARYQPRFGFGQRVGDAVRAAFLPALRVGMDRALATSVKNGSW